jgi:hypothetical protein
MQAYMPSRWRGKAVVSRHPVPKFSSTRFALPEVIEPVGAVRHSCSVDRCDRVRGFGADPTPPALLTRRAAS